jgi:hypothetical protein
MHLTTQYFRLPALTATAQIQWVQDPKLCKFIRNLVVPAVGIDELLQILLERLAAPTVERSVLDACTAFAAGVVLPASRHFHYELHQTLRRYHPAAALELGDLLQMGLEILSQPQMLLLGFAITQARQNWYPALRSFVQRKYQLMLIDRIRQCNGASNFKRTNNGLIVRTSTIKTGEALQRAGSDRVTERLLLQRSLRMAVKQHQFDTSNPRSLDYENLWHLYQQELSAHGLPLVSLAQTSADLQYLGCCLRNYENHRVCYLDERVGQSNVSWGDRLKTENWLEPWEFCVQQEGSQLAQNFKRMLRNRFLQAPLEHRQALYLHGLGLNDNQIGQRLAKYPSTLKRQRDKLFLQMVRDCFPTLPLTTKSIHFSQIAAILSEFYRDACEEQIADLARGFQDNPQLISNTLKAIGHHWNLSLCPQDSLLQQRVIVILRSEGIQSA